MREGIMARTDWIGLRVARWRDISGMTQQELADAIGVSRPYIAMIESGARAVTKRSLLIRLATALRVSITDLTGQPDQPRTPDDHAIYHAVPEVRGALDDDPSDTNPVDITVLTADVDRAMAARMACDYQGLAALLPGLITDTRRLADGGNQVGLALFVRVAVTAALTIKPFGYVDLATRLAERANLAAAMLGEPVELAAAQFMTAQTALSSGTAGGRLRSLTMANRAADKLGDLGDDASLSIYGMLRLHAALSAASLGQHDDVPRYLAEAESAADRVSVRPVAHGVRAGERGDLASQLRVGERGVGPGAGVRPAGRPVAGAHPEPARPVAHRHRARLVRGRRPGPSRTPVPRRR